MVVLTVWLSCGLAVVNCVTAVLLRLWARIVLLSPWRGRRRLMRGTVGIFGRVGPVGNEVSKNNGPEGL